MMRNVFYSAVAAAAILLASAGTAAPPTKTTDPWELTSSGFNGATKGIGKNIMVWIC